MGMSGYGIAGADAAMGQVLASAGWREEAPGFYLTDETGLAILVRTMHALQGVAVPRGCRLFEVGEVVDLAGDAGPARSGVAAQRVPAAPFGGVADEGTPFPMASFTPGAGIEDEQPVQRPVDPLEQMLASGYFDDDEDDLTEDAAEAVKFSRGAADAPEHDEHAAEPDAPADDDDDYNLEMMKVYGLR